jgi:hypothetical protein
MGRLPFNRARSETSFNSGQSSAFSSQFSDGSKDVAEATLDEMHRLLKEHRKALQPSFFGKILNRRRAQLRLSLKEYLRKLQVLQDTFEEKKHALPSFARPRECEFQFLDDALPSQNSRKSKRILALGDRLVILFDDIKTSLRNVETEVRYGRDGAIIDACTIEIGKLNDRLASIFDAPALLLRRLSSSPVPFSVPFPVSSPVPSPVPSPVLSRVSSSVPSQISLIDFSLA